MAPMRDEHAKLFLAKNYGVVATLRHDGSPQQTAVWVDWDGERVVLNLTRDRKKTEYLRRDPRASVFVFDGDDPYRWIAVSGPVELDDDLDGAEAHIHRLSRKYRGREYVLKPGEQRLIARLTPERVSVYGLDS